MNLDDAKAVFDAELPRLFAGSNYIIDASTAVVFEAVVWANGGIAWVKEFRPRARRYEDVRAYALARRDTLFKPVRSIKADQDADQTAVNPL